jgi:hypothetical protein
LFIRPDSATQGVGLFSSSRQPKPHSRGFFAARTQPEKRLAPRFDINGDLPRMRANSVAFTGELPAPDCVEVPFFNGSAGAIGRHNNALGTSCSLGEHLTSTREKPDALLILADRVFLHNRNRMMDFAIEHRLPSVNAYREVVEAGGLMSYGPSYEDMHRRAADDVDKILKGAKPGDLPVEQPTKFTLILNLKAAKALDLDVPPMLIARADEVIE